MVELLQGREGQVIETGEGGTVELACGKASLAGSVSQRACVFCGSRVVLYPIADALHVLNFARKKFGTLFDFSAKLAGWKKFLAGNFQTKS
jgi:hypothetical protein